MSIATSSRNINVSWLACPSTKMTRLSRRSRTFRPSCAKCSTGRSPTWLRLTRPQNRASTSHAWKSSCPSTTKRCGQLGSCQSSSQHLLSRPYPRTLQRPQRLQRPHRLSRNSRPTRTVLSCSFNRFRPIKTWTNPRKKPIGAGMLHLTHVLSGCCEKRKFQPAC